MSAHKLYEILVGKAVDILGDDYVSPELKQALNILAEQSLEDYSAKAISAGALVREAVCQEIARLEEIDLSMFGNARNPLGNKGPLVDKGDTDHEFKKDNICPYFLDKFELCALDGRLCPYDSETYLVCKRYKEGMDKKIPGKNGQVPDIAPTSSLPTQDPANTDNQTRGY